MRDILGIVLNHIPDKKFLCRIIDIDYDAFIINVVISNSIHYNQSYFHLYEIELIEMTIEEKIAFEQYEKKIELKKQG